MFLKSEIRLHLFDRVTAAGHMLVSGGLRLVEVALEPSAVQRGAQTRQWSAKNCVCIPLVQINCDGDFHNTDQSYGCHIKMYIEMNYSPLIVCSPN